MITYQEANKTHRVKDIDGHWKDIFVSFWGRNALSSLLEGLLLCGLKVRWGLFQPFCHYKEKPCMILTCMWRKWNQEMEKEPSSLFELLHSAVPAAVILLCLAVTGA